MFWGNLSMSAKRRAFPTIIILQLNLYGTSLFILTLMILSLLMGPLLKACYWRTPNSITPMSHLAQPRGSLNIKWPNARQGRVSEERAGHSSSRGTNGNNNNSVTVNERPQPSCDPETPNMNVKSSAFTVIIFQIEQLSFVAFCERISVTGKLCCLLK